MYKTINTHLHLPNLLQEIGNLRNLRFLEASENHLMALPVTIDGLSLLTDLYLQENLLSMLPDTIGERGERRERERKERERKEREEGEGVGKER